MAGVLPEVTIIDAVRAKIAGIEEPPENDADAAELIGELLFLTGKKNRSPAMKLDAYLTIAAYAIERATKIQSGTA